MCWFYVKNGIFVHTTGKIFPMTSPLRRFQPSTTPQSEGARTTHAIVVWQLAHDLKYQSINQFI